MCSLNAAYIFPIKPIYNLRIGFLLCAPFMCTVLAHHYCLKRTKFVLLYIKSPFLKHSSVFLLSASFAFFFGKI